MKRMSEVFELPLSYVDAAEFTVNLTKDEVKAVQLSVNHVDALADALEMMLSDNLTMSKWLSDNYWDAEDSENFKQAKKALAAYRGGK